MTETGNGRKRLEKKAGVLVTDPDNGGKIAGVQLPTWAIQAIAIGTVVFTYFGVNGKVSDLETRVESNARDIKKVQRFDERVDVLNDKLKKFGKAIEDIKDVKHDILEAVGDAIRRSK